MPSYQYLRNANPNRMQPEPPKNYTKKEKALNWLHYHWKLLLVLLVIAVAVVVFIVQMTTRTEPDYTIGMLTTNPPPNEVIDLMQDGLAAQLPDLNGDGQTVVFIDVYTLSPPAEEVPGEGDASLSTELGEVDPQLHMAGITRLSAALSVGEPIVFLLEGTYAEAYQTGFELLANPADGTVSTAPVQALTTAWEDTAVLPQLDLMAVIYDNTYDGHWWMDGYRLGVRLYCDSALEGQKDGLARWQQGKALYQWLVQGGTPAFGAQPA